MEFATIIFNLLYSMFWAGGVTFVVILIVDGVIMTLKKNKAIREARDAGHEIIAKRVDFKSQRGQSRNKIIGYYEYRYDNKTYKYKNTFYQYPPEEITLYFKNKPEKAKTEDSFGGAESGYGTVFFGVTILMFILRLVWFVGGMTLGRKESECGEIMLEGMIVMILTMFILIWVLGVGFLYYQRYLVTAITNDIAVKIASTYNNPDSDLIMGYITAEELSERDLVEWPAKNGASFNRKREKHAKSYYEEIRNRKSNYVINRLAKNGNVSKETAQDIYEHVFIKEHLFEDGAIRRFDADYDMAESFRRILEVKNIKAHDIVMLNHENLELSLMKKYNTCLSELN